MTEDLASAITDHVAAFLLRYFRPAVAADAKVIRIDAERDRDLLRLQWALSGTVTRLANYILAHRHESQSFLVTRERSDGGTVRGRIDARATLLRRAVGGDPSIVVAHEPVRSFDSGPNHVTVWVLQHAWLLAARFSALLPPDATYRTSSDAAAGRLERVRKISAISAAMAEINLLRRPGAGALRAAARSRRQTYRLAYEAYSTLAAVEAGDAVAIESVPARYLGCADRNLATLRTGDRACDGGSSCRCYGGADAVEHSRRRQQDPNRRRRPICDILAIPDLLARIAEG